MDAKMTKRKRKTETEGFSAAAEELIARIFEPDALARDQYLEAMRPKGKLEPELALMLAVLEDGINCFKDNASAASEEKRKLYEEAKEWIFSDDSDWIFSFVSICEAFDLNPAYIRRGLRSALERAGGGRGKKDDEVDAAEHRFVA
jgi:hypothetical protein